MRHHPDDLVQLFHQCFLDTFRTELVKGGAEPEYIPADGQQAHHRIVFTRDYFASALHEVSHWCIAGSERRQQYDYGYWYCPDGRTASQQAAFEKVEVKPQALEWIFSEAAAFRFRVSLDNLSGGGGADEEGFRLAVAGQAKCYLERGLPGRAATFMNALLDFYGTRSCFGPHLFSLPEEPELRSERANERTESIAE